jgi:hypothetical protein
MGRIKRSKRYILLSSKRRRIYRHEENDFFEVSSVSIPTSQRSPVDWPGFFLLLTEPIFLPIEVPQ